MNRRQFFASEGGAAVAVTDIYELVDRFVTAPAGVALRAMPVERHALRVCRWSRRRLEWAASAAESSKARQRRRT